MNRRIAVVMGTPAGQNISAEAPRHIRDIIGSGFAAENVGTCFYSFSRTQYDIGLAAIANIDAGITAANAGFHAIFLNTFGDYGLAELRSALDIPVVGAGEAAMIVAAGLGRRFAIVTVWPRAMRFLYDERIATSQMVGRCVGVRHVLDDAETEAVERGDSDNVVSQMSLGQGSMVDRIVKAAQAAVADDGADTIVLGCTCMSPVGKAVAARLAVPVVEASAAGYKMTEMLLSLKLSQSAVAFPKPRAGRLGIVGALVTGSSTVPSDEDCAVCVMDAQAAE